MQNSKQQHYTFWQNKIYFMEHNGNSTTTPTPRIPTNVVQPNYYSNFRATATAATAPPNTPDESYESYDDHSICVFRRSNLDFGSRSSSFEEGDTLEYQRQPPFAPRSDPIYSNITRCYCGTIPNERTPAYGKEAKVLNELSIEKKEGSNGKDYARGQVSGISMQAAHGSVHFNVASHSEKHYATVTPSPSEHTYAQPMVRGNDCTMGDATSNSQMGPRGLEGDWYIQFDYGNGHVYEAQVDRLGQPSLRGSPVIRLVYRDLQGNVTNVSSSDVSPKPSGTGLPRTGFWRKYLRWFGSAAIYCLKN